MIWFLGFAVFLLLIYRFLIKPQLYWYFKNVKQGYPKPVLGDNYKFALRKKPLIDMHRDLYSEFPNARYRGFYQASIPTLMISDPELIKQITIKDFEYFVNRRFPLIKTEDQIWTNNLLALKDDRWRTMRPILSPTFTSSKMKAMFSLINQSGEQYVKYYLNQKKPTVEVNLKDSFTRFAVDVIANCAFGITTDSLTDKENIFFHNAVNAANTQSWKFNLTLQLNMIAPKLVEKLNIRRFDEDIGNYFKQAIYEAIEYREKNNIVRPDVINLLLEVRKGTLKHEEDLAKSEDVGFAAVDELYTSKAKFSKMPELTNLDMAGQIMLFFLAGFGTVSTTMSFMTCLLAQHPDVQEKLREEIDEHYRASKGKLSYDTLPKMKYLDMVISETLRKYPAFVGAERECSKPYVIDPVLPDEKPLHLNVDDVIFIPIVGLHYDSKYYPDPERFDPERFSDENKHNINATTYMPFGIGPRNCIGSRFALMELKIMSFHLLSKFEIVVTEKTTVPVKLATGSFSPDMEGGFWVGFKKRTDIVTF